MPGDLVLEVKLRSWRPSMCISGACRKARSYIYLAVGTSLWTLMLEDMASIHKLQNAKSVGERRAQHYSCLLLLSFIDDTLCLVWFFCDAGSWPMFHGRIASLRAEECVFLTILSLIYCRHVRVERACFPDDLDLCPWRRVGICFCPRDFFAGRNLHGENEARCRTPIAHIQ